MPQSFTIVHMEMINVLVAIRVWAPSWADTYVSIKCDNAAVVQVLNSVTTRDPMLAAIVRNIWYETALHNIQFKLVHLPGVLNKCADLLSRWDLRGNLQQLHVLVANPRWCNVTPEHLHIDPTI